MTRHSSWVVARLLYVRRFAEQAVGIVLASTTDHRCRHYLPQTARSNSFDTLHCYCARNCRYYSISRGGVCQVQSARGVPQHCGASSLSPTGSSTTPAASPYDFETSKTTSTAASSTPEDSSTTFSPSCKQPSKVAAVAQGCLRFANYGQP